MQTEDTQPDELDTLLQNWTQRNTLTASQSDTIRLAARSVPAILVEELPLVQWNLMFAALNSALMRSLQICRESSDRAFHPMGSMKILPYAVE